MVAYGIQGDMVSYTVNYQDGGGNELAPSRTYYGAVGDKPVIAYQYIEGYRPDAYNLTKTLGKNEADNVFTLHMRSQASSSLLQAVKERKAVRIRARQVQRLRQVQRQVVAQGQQGPVQRQQRELLRRRR